MPEANVRTVERAIVAINERDLVAYSELCHPDWELFTPLAPLEGSLKGEAGIRAFIAALDEATTAFNFDVDELRAVDADRVLALLRLSVVSRGGVPITQSQANVYELLDGKLRRVDVYVDPKEAFEELDLVE